jgi:plastocyanin
MRGILDNRRRRTTAIGATVTAAFVAVLLAGALTPAAGRGQHRAHRRGSAVRVDIGDFAFHPHTLRVRRGTKVVFANSDPTAHTATRRGSFSTGRIRPRHSVTVKLRRAGVYAYHCTIHPFMHGKIVVR